MIKTVLKLMELSKTKLATYSSLSSKKMRLRHGLFAVEGTKAVVDTLDYYQPEAIVVRKGVDIGEVLNFPDIREKFAGKIFEAGDQAMSKLSSLSTSPDVIAIFRLPDNALEMSGSGQEAGMKLRDELYILLDGVQDPGNLGTIIRTAHWFGVKRIFASADTADLFNPKVIQATMGSLPHVEVSYCDLKKLISDNPSFPVYGLLLDGENIYDAALSQKGFIIMGNEGKGIRQELREMVTSPLLIPPYDASCHGESLNVAIATAVTLSIFRGRCQGAAGRHPHNV